MVFERPSFSAIDAVSYSMRKMNCLIVAALIGVALTMPACSSPDCVNRANYTQIQQNVHTQADVEAILGEPDSKLADMWIYQRPDDHLTVMIDFDADGRVARKQWVDGVQGAWDDTNQPRRP